MREFLYLLTHQRPIKPKIQSQAAAIIYLIYVNLPLKLCHRYVLLRALALYDLESLKYLIWLKKVAKG